MSTYEVRFSRNAEKQMRRLPDKAFDRVLTAARELADEPRPRASIALQGQVPSRRLRVDDYRVLYTVYDKDQLVSIESVKRRTTTTYKDR